MSIAIVVLEEIASKLLKNWKGAGVTLPTSSNLQDALRSLITFGELVLPSNLTAADVTAELLKKIGISISQFKNLNDLLGHDNLDQIFDAASVEIANKANCNGTANSTAAPFSENDKMAILAYKIDPSVRPTIDGFSTKDLIEAAVEEWAFNTRTLLFKNVTDSSPGTFCNVKIIESDLGRSGRVLGQAPKAGRGSLRDLMQLEINFHVNWTKELFMGTVTHEFGHIAGLDHIPGNDLMNPTIPIGLFRPQQADLTAFNALWP